MNSDKIDAIRTLLTDNEKWREMVKSEELREKLLRLAAEGNWGEIENLVASGIPKGEPIDYLNHWLNISRCFGYATQDGSWNEFEKEFAIIISRMLRAETERERMIKSLIANRQN